MAGEVVVDGVVVEVEVGGRELPPGRARPARGPAEANLGKRFGWMLKHNSETQDMQVKVLTTRAARATQRARPRVRAKTRATWAEEDLILVPIWGEEHL